MKVYIDDRGDVWQVTSVDKYCTESVHVNTHYEALIIRDEWLRQQPQYEGGMEYEAVDSYEGLSVPPLGSD